jgi:hypothetical protein
MYRSNQLNHEKILLSEVMQKVQRLRIVHLIGNILFQGKKGERGQQGNPGIQGTQGIQVSKPFYYMKYINTV